MKPAIIKAEHQRYITTVLAIGICAFVSVIVHSCYGKGGMYTIEKTIDSLETEIQLDNIINGFYIAVDLDNREFYRGLHESYDLKRRNLRYLPYLCLVLNDRYLPKAIISTYSDMIFEMCALSPNDSVYNLGKTCYVRSNDRYNELFKSDSINAPWDFNEERDPIIRTVQLRVQIEGKTYNLDSLRISVIGYNDRNALGLLEKYYKGIDMGKELAAYYKVMLGFEGNGDLAERYYEVLKPYLAKQPEFYNSIRETLLRAALCDHNARAQELCDSLGFSLCDYRKPVLGRDMDFVKKTNK